MKRNGTVEIVPCFSGQREPDAHRMLPRKSLFLLLVRLSLYMFCFSETEPKKKKKKKNTPVFNHIVLPDIPKYFVSSVSVYQRGLNRSEIATGRAKVET